MTEAKTNIDTQVREAIEQLAQWEMECAAVGHEYFTQSERKLGDHCSSCKGSGRVPVLEMLREDCLCLIYFRGRCEACQEHKDKHGEWCTHCQGRNSLFNYSRTNLDAILSRVKELGWKYNIHDYGTSLFDSVTQRGGTSDTGDPLADLILALRQAMEAMNGTD